MSDFNPEIAIKDIEGHLHSVNITMTETALNIFIRLENLCSEKNVMPIYEHYLIPLIEQVPPFGDAINKHVGNCNASLDYLPSLAMLFLKEIHIKIVVLYCIHEGMIFHYDG